MKFFRISLLLLLFFSAILSADLYAQDEPPPLVNKETDEILRVDTQLVEVPIVVADKSGKPLRNLKQTNFIVYEDGKKQEVTEFTTTEAPFEVALLLDTSGSARSDLRFIKRAAATFINSLRPGDRVAIIAFNTARDETRAYAVSEILTNLTDDRLQLKDALDRVSISNGTPYYDSLLQISEDVFNKAPTKEFRGRRAIVALTDGVDSTSVADFGEASENLSKIGVATYFIQVDTREFFEEELLGDCEVALRFSKAQIRRYYRTFFPRSKVEKVMDFCKIGDFERLDMSKRLYWLANEEMKKLSKISGGKIFAVADLSEARQAFIKVAEEIGTQYYLGYYSKNEKRDGKYRKIKVELQSVPAGATIRAREGYTAPRN